MLGLPTWRGEANAGAWVSAGLFIQKRILVR